MTDGEKGPPPEPSEEVPSKPPNDENQNRRPRPRPRRLPPFPKPSEDGGRFGARKWMEELEKNNNRGDDDNKNKGDDNPSPKPPRRGLPPSFPPVPPRSWIDDREGGDNDADSPPPSPRGERPSPVGDEPRGGRLFLPTSFPARRAGGIGPPGLFPAFVPVLYRCIGTTVVDAEKFERTGRPRCIGLEKKLPMTEDTYRRLEPLLSDFKRRTNERRRFGRLHRFPEKSSLDELVAHVKTYKAQRGRALAAFRVVDDLDDDEEYETILKGKDARDRQRASLSKTDNTESENPESNEPVPKFSTSSYGWSYYVVLEDLKKPRKIRSPLFMGSSFMTPRHVKDTYKTLVEMDELMEASRPKDLPRNILLSPPICRPGFTRHIHPAGKGSHNVLDLYLIKLEAVDSYGEEEEDKEDEPSINKGVTENEEEVEGDPAFTRFRPHEPLHPITLPQSAEGDPLWKLAERYYQSAKGLVLHMGKFYAHVWVNMKDNANYLAAEFSDDFPARMWVAAQKLVRQFPVTIHRLDDSARTLYRFWTDEDEEDGEDDDNENDR